MLSGQYLSFYRQAFDFIPESRLISDELRTLTYGTDASFYRLVPKLIVIADCENEVAKLMKLADELQVPICFRAAGTSLSGQALTDSILIKLSDKWKNCEVLDAGRKIRMAPMLLGSEANNRLRSFNTMLAPMPASIDSATVGGMAINNAAGMNSLDTYGMMESAKFVFLNGQELDTGCESSRSKFKAQSPEIVDGIARIAAKLKADEFLTRRVKKKFQIKNTTGYGLRALLDFDDPIDILAHLMIGSEGTLGFISEITHNTIPIYKFKASAFLVFSGIEMASKAVMRFKANQTPVSAAEMIDYYSMQAVADKTGVPSYLQSVPPGSVAILVQTESDSKQELQRQVDLVLAEVEDLDLVIPPEFSDDPEVYEGYWQVRKGIFPAVGAKRPSGTTTLIEDVAFPVDRLAEALVDLQQLMRDHGYMDGVIYGHALDGNLHFIFSQSFETKADIARYRAFMEAVCSLVIDKYDGSLKAEHGTGRNMAPFVRQEWGDTAYGLMVEIKQLLDPKRILNPDVMLTEDRELFVKNIKPMPRVNEVVDRCIECGFCERMCPSKNLTLTPRQMIVGKRHLSSESAGAQAEFAMQFEYYGVDTCAGCGLCETVCPVEIDTGDLIRQERAVKNAPHRGKAQWAADHFSGVATGVKTTLKVANLAHTILGSELMQKVSDGGRSFSGNRIGKWTPAMPTAAEPIEKVKSLKLQPKFDKKVVYLPSCASRTMGPAKGATCSRGIFETTISLLNKAGYEVILPNEIEALCCGLPFESKGMFKQAKQKADELFQQLSEASNGGRYPIYSDTSPCSARLKELNEKGLQLYDSVEFIHKYLLSALDFRPTENKLACHITCSARRMGHDAMTREIMARCSHSVVFPDEVTCCGWAGDKGFTTPELNASALKELRPQVSDCIAGYSTSRTCEIGLSHHSGIEYQSLVYLVDACTRTKSE